VQHKAGSRTSGTGQMSSYRLPYDRVLALIAGTIVLTVGPAQTAHGASAESPGQPANAHIARTTAAPWCWKRMYGSSCRPSPPPSRKAQKKPDRRPMLIIGIGF